MSYMKTIYFAGGCFWGVEEYFSRIDGVLDTTVGYANGGSQDPSYEEVCTGATGHAEAVKIDYNPEQVGLDALLEKYWAIVDPTIKDRQGPDKGTQYRTGIYYIEESDHQIIVASINNEQNKYEAPIVTEVKPLENFFNAEEYHQDYLKKNPNGYCHISLD